MRDTDPAAGRLTASAGAPPAPRAGPKFELRRSHLDWGKYSSNLAYCQVWRSTSRRSHGASQWPNGVATPTPRTALPPPGSGAFSWRSSRLPPAVDYE